MAEYLERMNKQLEEMTAQHQQVSAATADVPTRLPCLGPSICSAKQRLVSSTLLLMILVE
jgi:hypothetical protein